MRDLKDPMTTVKTETLADIQANEIVMIGDRVLTDTVFANKNGMYSILVKPLCIKTDHPISVIFRFLERRLLMSIVRLLGFTSKAPESIQY